MSGRDRRERSREFLNRVLARAAAPSYSRTSMPDRRRVDLKSLRFWFLLPAWVWLIFLFLAPLAIVCAYSLLTRGVYGGVELPRHLVSYQLLIDTPHAIILL